jgi:hypothetical protein
MSGSIKVVDLLSQAQTLLLDAAGNRWSLPELQIWLNAAYREIVNIRPDSNTSVATFTCAAGIRQDLTIQFPGATELVEVVRNVASGSNHYAVIEVDRKSLDDQRRSWPADPSSISIDNFMYDPRVPWQFLVYPPALSTAQLEVIYNSVPTPHTLTLVQLQNPATAETIRLIDTYANPLLDYVMYRSFSKDSDDPSNEKRAAGHYQAMKDSLIGKTAGDNSAQPGAA